MADTRVQGGFLLTDFQGRFLLTDLFFIPGNWTGMSIGVYAAASLGMDGVGVYCSWEMPGPGWSTLHHHLHYVPGERSFSATRVLVVCSACQLLVFVN